MTGQANGMHQCSVRNRSGIIAQHGCQMLTKPSIVDLILRLPETNF